MKSIAVDVVLQTLIVTLRRMSGFCKYCPDSLRILRVYVILIVCTLLWLRYHREGGVEASVNIIQFASNFAQVHNLNIRVSLWLQYYLALNFIQTV